MYDFFFVGFHSFACFSAKPITCLYIFGWMRVLCWSIGWLVGWSTGCVSALSLTRTLIVSPVRSFSHLPARSFARALYIISFRACVCLYMCKYLSFGLPCKRQHKYHLDTHTYTFTFVHIYTCRTLTHIYIYIRGIRLPMSLVSASNT